MPREPLRAAVLLDFTIVPAWALEAIRRVAAEGHARWSVILLNRSAKKQNFIQRMRQNCRTALASSYLRLDQLVSPADRDPLAPYDAEQLLLDVPQLTADEQNNDSLGVYDLDVIVSFSRQAASDDVLAAAKLGVWMFEHGGLPDHGRAEFNGLYEVLAESDVNRASLQMLTRDNRLVTLAEIFTAVDRLSVARNRGNLYWPAVSLLPRQLERLQQLGEKQFCERLERSGIAANSIRTTSPRPLTGRTLTAGLVRLGIRRLKRKLAKQFCRDQWFMASRFNPAGDARDAASWESPGETDSAWFAGGAELQEMIPPIDRFWADPHAICRNGKHYVFFEEYLYVAGKAHISVMEFDDRGQWHSPRPVIERPYHLSYPFLFDWQGELYMIPETSANRTLEVYRCEEFPDRWTLHKVIWRQVKAFDATLLEHAGHWWMFVTLAECEGGSSYDELSLFHADHPLSDHWLPHPQNPIVSDVRCARMAGPIICDRGRLIRPAQDGSRRYGYGLRLHHIETLSPTRYVETEFRRIEPLVSRDWLATHTISSAGGMTMFDAQRQRFKFDSAPKLLNRTAATWRHKKEVGMNG
ncbi:MAG: hypothetical protein IT427_01365 [Pirellulales bacterium]|nr:hypothetical protein [Pirellulales bacterium]